MQLYYERGINMFKKVLIALFLTSATLSWGKAPFGIFKDSIQPESAGNKIWQTILSEQPITLKLTLPDEEEINRPRWEQELQQAFNQWFVHAYQFIEQSGRAKEFADVLPVLQKGLHFGPQGLEENITVLNSIKKLRYICGDERANACASRNTYTLILPTNEVLSEAAEELNLSPVSLSKIMTHEFGHQLGLIDQNPDDTDRQKNRVLPSGHSTHMHVKDTAMSGSYEQGAMGCDDVDALINVIDLHRAGAQGSRRGKKWKSFCQTSNDYFVDGKNQQVVNKYHIQPTGDEQTWFIDLAQAQSPARMRIERNQTLYPKQIIATKDITQNKQTASLKTKGPHGEIIYYDYFQGIQRQAAIREDATAKHLLWVRVKRLDRKTNQYIHELYFGSKGSFVVMKWMKPSYFYYEELSPYNEQRLAVRSSVELACQTENEHLACEVKKDSFTKKAYSKEEKRNSVLLGEIDFNASAVEQEIFRKTSINRLINFFQDLPEK